MAVTLAEVKARAREAIAAGEWTSALAALEHALGAAPQDDELRLEIADALARAGKTDDAGEIYRALCLHLVRAGRPLPAIVAADALATIGMPRDYLLGALADMYAAGSETLRTFAVRPAPPDPALELPPLPELPATEPLDRVAARAAERALAMAGHAPYQSHVHPIAFLSELEPDSLRAVLANLRVRRLKAGESIVRQGEPGTSLYLVASGELDVVASSSAGTRELARLHENSLFGEMALVTSQPRGASVTARAPAVVLELEREALDRVRAEIPSIEAALARFTRERLIRNLLATSPLFTPFSREQQNQLLRRFEGTEVDAGTVIIAEGQPGQGLYVVLTGELAVSCISASGERLELARLRPGDICGEMSLVSDQPTSATVQALSAATLLFLPKVYVERLAEAIPEVRRYFAGVAQRRSADNTARLGAALPEEFVDLGDDGDDSDTVLI